jgi:hypothetical protein
MLLGGVANLDAQVTTASIYGTATDPTGALITGATVTATNTSTGISAMQKTNSKGYFLFSNLHIGGPYSVTVEQSGFRRFTVTGILLNLSSSHEVNAVLQIGASSLSVMVRTNAVQVETADVQLKHVLDAAHFKSYQRWDGMWCNCRRRRPVLSNPRTVRERFRPTVARPRRIHTWSTARM